MLKMTNEFSYPKILKNLGKNKANTSSHENRNQNRQRSIFKEGQSIGVRPHPPGMT